MNKRGAGYTVLNSSVFSGWADKLLSLHALSFIHYLCWKESSMCLVRSLRFVSMAQSCDDFLRHHHTSQWQRSAVSWTCPSSLFFAELPSDAFCWERFTYNQTMFFPVRVHHIFHRWISTDWEGVKLPAATPTCGGSLVHGVSTIHRYTKCASMFQPYRKLKILGEWFLFNSN